MTWLPFGDRLYNIICPNMAGNSHYVSKCMGSEDEEMYGLWVMGFGDKNPANQLGKPKNVWVCGEYGL